MKNSLKLGSLALALAVTGCQKNELSAVNSTPSIKTPHGAMTRTVITNTYYVDDTGGNDGNPGTSSTNAWKTLTKVNSVTFAAGSRILFKRGGSWTGQLRPHGSGTSSSYDQIDAWGSGARPVINGNGVQTGSVYLYNQQYWEIRNLEITNFKSSEEGGKTIAQWEAANNSTYANVTLPAAGSNSNSAKLGVNILEHDFGVVHHVYLANLLVHGINSMVNEADTAVNYGGIAYQITGTATPTYFDDVLVDSCNIHDVDKTGMYFQSTWDTRTATTNTNWTPSRNIDIANNTFNNTAANALIVRVSVHAVIEHNLFDHCAIKLTGNAAFNFNTDSCKWQFNTARYTKANVGDKDAGGIDADYRTKYTVIQYNYLHNNDYGMLVTGGGGVFNIGTQVKYNIIEKDGLQAHPTNGKFALKVAGASTNTLVFNNTIDIGPSQSGTNVFLHSQCTVWPDETTYYNNIVDNAGTSTVMFSKGSSTSNTFDYNNFYNNTASGIPTQTHNITGDAKLSNPGQQDSTGYKLLTGSVDLLTGKLISGNGGKDYFGNTVSASTPPNVGCYNGPSL